MRDLPDDLHVTHNSLGRKADMNPTAIVQRPHGVQNCRVSGRGSSAHGAVTCNLQ